MTEMTGEKIGKVLGIKPNITVLGCNREGKMVIIDFVTNGRKRRNI